MCVIIFSPCEGNRPSNKTLELCNKANPHGIGIVTQGNKDMYSVSKGLSLELVKKIIEKTSGAIAIHFRYATAGGNSKNLCHPFPCTPKAETWLDYEASDVLMSNGTWMNWEQSYEIIKKLGSIKAINGKMSDTRAMAHIVGTKRKTSWLREITDKHPNHKRVRTLYMSKTQSKSVNFIGEWKTFEGCKFSNLRWKTTMAKKRKFYVPSATQQDFASWLDGKY